ncbi:Isocitrate dehydrogenase [Cyanidiococcus yangmingshanensis]|uniref:Isocitrate dehydrogenase n=1 Tax=Cyanidiococcus yangmingshanensis TaxID=2690220 RepID=A0A7J7IQG4_9RHOD|nr:Isocitrate dehydrogenase [Cyanidiococcus yangmingshanensis]
MNVHQSLFRFGRRALGPLCNSGSWRALTSSTQAPTATDVRRFVSPALRQGTPIISPTSIDGDVYNVYPSATSLGDTKLITLLPGEGIGPECMDSLVSVFGAANVPVEFEAYHIPEPEKGLPSAIVDAVNRNRLVMKGPFHTPYGFQGTSINILLRRGFDLFANVVHVFPIPGVKAKYDNIDIVLVRENTEGEYSGLEHSAVDGVVESLKIVTEEHSLRIAEYAFRYAMRNNRKKVTCVHKANILKSADGLFLECARQVASKYPFIEFESMIVDATCMRMVSQPQHFDVVLLPNLYGNIVGSVATSLGGGTGLFPGANIGPSGAMFEQGVRHAGKGIAGKGIANPTATILAGVMMLRYLKMFDFADFIQDAVTEVYENTDIRTPDMGGRATTKEFTAAIIEKMEEIMAELA